LRLIALGPFTADMRPLTPGMAFANVIEL